MERSIAIRSGDMTLSGVLHTPSSADQAGNKGRRPFVLICHGFVGNKIGANRLFVKAARALCAAGHSVLRFDFGGCGESTGEYGSTGLGSMIEQTRHVLDYAFSADWVDPERVAVLGHSLGGAVALLAAARDRRIRALILWSPVAHPLHDIVQIVGRHVYERCKAEGAADYLGYRLTAAFFESLEQFQPFQEARKFFGDVLLVHGTSDEVIPVDYSFLYQKAFWLRGEGSCEKEIILQADHTFSSSEACHRAISRTVEWLGALAARKREWNDWTI
ncbi:MAG: alpha/beta hydrolase [Candidatus Reconcilbacillus cellulovorans]|uniref:Alpha/beta hydrolase n=1 Tax=Candidatus Reconcilbacillus cellulovorans TaxID=1906605 RepID=A0A2A6E163_9BACL|nr:MAG: alpha/beta hydrolase [Candidatus Reconcilbacillus cellulovorans]